MGTATVHPAVIQPRTNNRTTESPATRMPMMTKVIALAGRPPVMVSYQEYQWDYRNRLTKVTQRECASPASCGRWNTNMDALNRLVHRTETPMEESPVEQFWHMMKASMRCLSSMVKDEVTHRYLWSGAVDQLLADEQVTSTSTGGNVLWPLADHLGTLRDIADYNEGNSTTRSTDQPRTYNAFGKLVSETNAAVDLIYGFTGKQLDEVIGLQHKLFAGMTQGLGNG